LGGGGGWAGSAQKGARGGGWAGLGGVGGRGAPHGAGERKGEERERRKKEKEKGFLLFEILFF
jgi:hypothetical protein